MSTIEIVGLEGALGHVTIEEHGNQKWYQQGGKKQTMETKATTDNSFLMGENG